MVYDYLPLDQHSKKPLYQQLYEQIRRAVQEGHLSQGEKMPSIRKLAEDLEAEPYHDRSGVSAAMRRGLFEKQAAKRLFCRRFQ